MNNRGQVMIYGLMLGIVIVVLALGFAPAVKERVEETMSAENLDCNNASISNFNRASCLAVDLTIFHFIGGLLFVAGTIITARIVFGD